MHQLTIHAANLAAMPTGIFDAGINNAWALTTKVVGFVVCLAAIGIMWAYKKKKLSDVAGDALIIMLGLTIFAVGAALISGQGNRIGAGVYSFLFG